MNSSILNLSPEIQLEVFKRLDSDQTVKLRQVCMQWMDLINQQKSFWRRISIPKNRKFDCIKSVINLFNEKSDGTMEQVVILTCLWGVEINPLIKTLKRSKSTLTTLFLQSSQGPVKLFSHFVSNGFSRLLDFRDYLQFGKPVVEVSRRSRASGQVLWTLKGLDVLAKHPEMFTSLLSFKLIYQENLGPLRKGLQDFSKTLKHLCLNIAPHSMQDSSSSLHFPNLQILELEGHISVFPSWMIVPSTLKVFTYRILLELPSIAELCVKSFVGFEGLASNCPELEALRFNDMNKYGLNPLRTSEQDMLLDLMIERMNNLEDGVEWEGIKMKKLKKLIIPLRTLDVEVIGTLRESAEELIDIPELKYPIIELEV